MDIFGSSNQVPRWLEEAARPASGREIGQALGNSLAEILTSLERNPEAPEGSNWLQSRKGPQEAAFEVRMNNQDPLWRQHLAIAGLGMKSKWLNMDLTNKRIDQMDANMDAKKKLEEDQAADNQLYSETIARVGADPDAIMNETMPAFKTVQGRLRWQAAVTSAKGSKDYLDEQQERIKNRQSDVNAAKEFNTRLRALDTTIPEIGQAYAAIKQEKDLVKQYTLLADAEAKQKSILDKRATDAGLTPSKIVTGPTGTRMTYGAEKKTPLQMAQEHRDSIDPDLDPESYKEAQKMVDKLTTSPLDVEAAREVNRQINAKQRLQDRLKVMGQAQQYKIDFAKLQQDAKAKLGSKAISEQQFIDRHLNSTVANVTKNWDIEALGPPTSDKVLAEATTLLKRIYRWTNGGVQINQPAAPTATTNSATKKLTYNPETDTFE